MDAAHIELWIAFGVVVTALLALDLFVFNRHAHKVTVKESLIWSVVWITLGLGFAGAIWWLLGREQALLYVTGYLVEKSLSVDNLFVFIMIFGYFGVDAKYQHRVLFWGVFGAIILRTVMILAGAALVQRFEWLMSVFGAFLIYSGIKLGFASHDAADPSQNIAVRLAKKFFPVSDKFDGENFFTHIDGKRIATPMLLVLVTIEFSDVVFAVDSIPAIFGITKDPFIVLTSNIFAILGLRALYFLLADVMDRFHYLKIGLSAVLAFIGVKMIVAYFGWYHFNAMVSLGIVGGLLALSIVASLLRPRQKNA